MLTATGEHSVCCGWFADLLMGITSRYASIVAAFTIKHQDWSGKAFDTLNFLAPQPTTITIPYLTAYLSRELLALIDLPHPPHRSILPSHRNSGTYLSRRCLSHHCVTVAKLHSSLSGDPSPDWRSSCFGSNPPTTGNLVFLAIF